MIDKNIWFRYRELLSDGSKRISQKIFEPLESKKNLDEVYEYISYLIKIGVQKDHKIFVIGGGLVQDIGSFSSHILLRGIDWIFVPTTLLSMADSCIGSKAGINVGK